MMYHEDSVGNLDRGMVIMKTNPAAHAIGCDDDAKWRIWWARAGKYVDVWETELVLLSE